MRGGVWIAAMLVTLAGCLDARDDGSADQGAEAPPEPEVARERTVPLDIEGCRVVELFTRVPAETARPHVHDAFVLVEVAPGEALTVLGGLVCEGRDAFARAFLALQVEPVDDALRDPDAAGYFWEPDHVLAAGMPGTAIYEELGSLHLESDEVTVRVGEDAASVRATLPGGALAIDVPVGAVPTSDVAEDLNSFREYSLAEDGLVFLEATYKAHAEERSAAFAATYTTAPETAARAILGASGTGVAIAFGATHYGSAEFGYEPWPPA